jgi:phosphate starvation-inducible PhoH-like protein
MAVITGDVTQIDLPDNKRSGLTDAVHLLSNIPGISFRYFTEVDVVRHPLVAQIIKAYDAARPPPAGPSRGPLPPASTPDAPK